MTDRNLDPSDTAGLYMYRLDVSGYTDDLPYWNSLVVSQKPRRLLELGSGLGRLLWPMMREAMKQRDDFRAVGLDISAPTLAIAKKDLANNPDLAARLELVEADMTDFDLRQPDSDERELFDLVVIAFNGFAYLADPEKQLSCLKAVRRHLAPGGLVGIDMIVPQLSYLALSQKGAPLRMGRDISNPAPGISRLIRMDSERYDSARQIEYDTWFYELYTDDGQVERATFDVAWQMVFPNELELMMRLAGLRVVSRYGDYERNPFDRHSDLYLWVAQRDDDPE